MICLIALIHSVTVLCHSNQMRGDARDNRFMATATVDGKPAYLLVDTGSKNVVLSSRWKAAKDGLTGVRSIGIGPLHQRVTVTFLASTEFDSNSPQKVDGVIGMTFLSKYTVGFDLPNATLELWASGTAPDVALKSWNEPGLGKAAQPVLIPLSMDPFGCPMLEGSVQGAQEKALLDTGSAASSMNVYSINDMGAVLLGSQVDVQLMGQNPSHLYTFKPSSLGLGGFSLSPPENVVILPGSRGGEDFILGADALSQFRFVIDFKGKELAMDSSALKKAEAVVPMPVDPGDPPDNVGFITVGDERIALKVGSRVFYHAPVPPPLLIAGSRVTWDYKKIDEKSGVFTLTAKP